MNTVHHITTADELLRTPGLGRCELLRGDLVMMSPSGSEHGYVIVNITPQRDEDDALHHAAA
jgi:hypothetical protein